MVKCKRIRRAQLRAKRKESELLRIEKLLEKNASVIDKTIEKYIPRQFTKEAFLFKITKPRYAFNTEIINKAIAEPIWEFLDRGGKRWRPSLFLLIVKALGKNPTEFIEFSIIPEVVHNGTLIVDDIEDASGLRR
jgi:geranylgeranyl diphosphate synthase type I